MKKEELLNKANDFIKKCHIIGLVYAIEGGVINLNSILVDFVGYLNSESSDIPEVQEISEGIIEYKGVVYYNQFPDLKDKTIQKVKCEHPLHSRMKGGQCGVCGVFLVGLPFKSLQTPKKTSNNKRGYKDINS